jgi:hypothetical protein
MSGFLRNLSAQALGRSAPVRSAARLAYAPLPATFEPPASEQTSSLLPAAPALAAGPLPNVADRTASSEPGTPHEIPSLLVPHHRGRAGDKPLPAPAMRAPADRDPMPMLARPAEAVAPARLPIPPPLVPVATRFVPPPAFAPALPASSTAAAGAHRHSASEAAEVHVSIGRIELTAVHEASPPARRAAPVKPSLSLHDYLARRQGRSS